MKLSYSSKGILPAIFVVSTAVLTSLNVPISAQTCELLEVIGSGDTEVTKTVSLPGTFLLDTNWNTDFLVDGNQSYRYFVVNFLSESGESYDIDVHLKYSDDSVDTAYSIRGGTFPEGEPTTIEASSRLSGAPYQINLRVGGLTASGNTYTASAMGCR